jgi:hypothetical protein
MKKLVLLFLLISAHAFGQQGLLQNIPDCSAGFCSGLGVPTFHCFSAQRYAQIDAPGTNFTCTGIPPHWVQDAPVTSPQLAIGSTAVAIPPTQRGIVSTTTGQTTPNGSVFLDIFGIGYNPWGSGITFEDYATTQAGAAITLGLADDASNSQRICFIGGRTATFDSVACMIAHGTVLGWPGSLSIGTSPSSGSGITYSGAAQTGYDPTNLNAVLNGGGATAFTNAGAALAVASQALGATYAFYCDKNANCGVGTQKTNATLDPFFVTPAGAVTELSTRIGGGSLLSRYARFTGTFSPSPVAANTCAAQSFTVSGVLVGDIMIGVNKPTEQAGLSVTPGHVTAANTATMNFCNNTAASISPTGSESYNLVVVQ